MSGQAEALAQSLRSVLDTFHGNAVAITGCHAMGIARSACEYDVIVVGEDRPPRTIRGTPNVDIFFVSEKDVLKPGDPEFIVSLSKLVELRDSSLVLSTARSAAQAMLAESARKSSETRLASALKALGRVDEALQKGRVGDADFWLLAAGYDYAFSCEYGAGEIPSPSHLLKQMKDLSKRARTNFESWSRATGLEHSSRNSAGKRLEALSILWDVLNTGFVRNEMTHTLERYTSDAAYETVDAKAKALISSLQSVDVYAYLGLEFVRALQGIQQLQAAKDAVEPDLGSIVTQLTTGPERIISESVINSIGLRRSARTIRRNASILQESVADLAKRI